MSIIILLPVVAILGMCLGGISSRSNTSMSPQQKQLALIETGGVPVNLYTDKHVDPKRVSRDYIRITTRR